MLSSLFRKNIRLFNGIEKQRQNIVLECVVVYHAHSKLNEDVNYRAVLITQENFTVVELKL